MINIPAVPKPTTPAFTDKVIVEIQDILKEKLTWLDYSFGRSQKLVTKKQGKEYFYPGVHIRSGKYLNVFPDQQLGNYSFFIIEDPQELDFNKNVFNLVTTNCSLIFWLNLDSIYSGSVDRNSEAIKEEIIKVITREMFLTTGRFSFNEIYEDAKNIYREYNLNEVASQFLMQPYCGFRFEGQLLFNENCTT